ncbi:MAG: hypothetical protein QMD46_04850 [Methanomicrobiales archaeon]|nr:hypothetical protein [Methanomicrobiales archaeon]
MQGSSRSHGQTAWGTRSMVKAVTCRIFIPTLDYLAVYLIANRYEIALVFVLVSNLPSGHACCIHERVWARIQRVCTV